MQGHDSTCTLQGEYPFGNAGLDHCVMNGVSGRERVESDVDEAMAMEVDSPLLLPGEEEEEGGGRGRGAAVDLDNPVDIEKVLAFGRDLQALFNQVTASKPNDKLKTMLQVRRERGREREMEGGRGRERGEREREREGERWWGGGCQC